MKRVFLAALALLLAQVQSVVFAEDVRLPEQAAMPDVPLVAKPGEGPQETEVSHSDESAKTEQTEKNDGASVGEGFTTTLASTGDSVSANAPDKAFAASSVDLKARSWLCMGQDQLPGDLRST
jgi:hypothetical protein